MHSWVQPLCSLAEDSLGNSGPEPARRPAEDLSRRAGGQSQSELGSGRTALAGRIMGLQPLSPIQLLCLLGALNMLPRAGALLCYEAMASNFRAVTFHNWKWLLLRSMVCKLREGCEETLIFIETGSKRGVVGFKGCTSSLSYPAQTSYLISPPGVSIASYSRVCRTYLCNNLTSLVPFVRLRANMPKSSGQSAQQCPTCVGRHDKECLPNFVSLESCPTAASACYGSTLKFQEGRLNTTILLTGCAQSRQHLLGEFHHIGSIRVTEGLNIMDRSQVAGARPAPRGPAWSVLFGFLLACKH
ncbi:ly6/PLAUR domain-containing protein 4 isoform X1 [Ochotona princeps]|uniref:ly6/PLAUR domain-containing protein 4 isoform X1 n=2 Tax=Ochotona princeps TaxID=9978 RepID=UPI00271530A5|nr:ly6/PLAUR domain-containing protein 4 isoform X1 [Ochotona princeps]